MSRRLLAEFIGTFFLVLAGPGAIMVEGLHPGAIGPLGIALAFGLIVAIMVFTLGPVSGAHINPAVTIAAWSVRRLPFPQVASYVIAQLSGAVVASLAARALLGPVASNGATIPQVGVAAAFIVEALLSLLVILSVLATDGAGSSRAGAAVMIGMTIGLCALVGGPLTGASMNPARSFGPALVSGTWTSHWLYWIAPIGGMLLGTRLSRGLSSQQPSP